MLDMGDNHLLSLYQEDCRLYSHFIPYLAELANEIRGEQGAIIDLGANVGDTVAAMIRNTTGKVLCIEPADEYYKLLKKNVETMQITSRVGTVQAFISNQKKNYQVVFSGGGQVSNKNIWNLRYRLFHYQSCLISVTSL